MSTIKILTPLTNIKCQYLKCNKKATHILLSHELEEKTIEERKNKIVSTDLIDKVEYEDIYYFACKEHAKKIFKNGWIVKEKYHLIINHLLCRTEKY